MSFFSFLGKAVGSVAKLGIKSLVPGGAQLWDIGEGIIKKKKAASNQQNLYDAAGLTDNYNPPARRTETAMPGAGAVKIPAYLTSGPAVEVPRPRRAARKRRAARAAPPAPRKRRRRGSSGARRSPPPGGLDLKAMSAEWRAAGKPGTWRDWIRENPITR